MAALALAVVAPPGASLGDAIQHGAGLGLYRAQSGTTCPDSPFVVQILHRGGGEAGLHTEVLGSCTDVVAAGVTLMVGTAGLATGQVPPVVLDLPCRGSEAAGLHCAALRNGIWIVVDVGPSAGPGSIVPLSVRGQFAFDGHFVSA